MSRSQQALTAVRQLLLFILATGMLGIAAELLISGHTENPLQWIPLGLIFTGLPVLGWVAFKPSQTSSKVFRFLMALFLISGVVGTGLHYKGKVEFKLESDPSLSGFALFREAIKSKSPPALAPGAMILLGLIGFTFVRANNSKGEQK